MSERCIHAVVRGRVQGVFFREFTRREADVLGLHGWVRNLTDGTVETVFAGEPPAVEKMLAWLRQGSPASKVLRLDFDEIVPDESLPLEFVIRG